MYNTDLSELLKRDAIAHDVFKAILSNKVIQRHIIDYEWLSGSSTSVYPITIHLRDVECQVDVNDKKRLEKSIWKIVKNNPDLFNDGYFCKSDGSCPSCIRLIYSNILLERIKNK